MLKQDPQGDHKLEEALGAFNLFVRGSNAKGLSEVGDLRFDLI